MNITNAVAPTVWDVPLHKSKEQELLKLIEAETILSLYLNQWCYKQRLNYCITSVSTGVSSFTAS